MRIKWALGDMARSYLNMSNNVREKDHPTYNLGSMQAAPQTRALQQNL